MGTGHETAQAAAAARVATAEVVARLTATTQALRAEHDRWRTTAAAHRTAREEAARRGELGAGARELQDRVDAGLTTWEAVVDGRDTSAAARAARVHVDQRVAALARER